MTGSKDNAISEGEARRLLARAADTIQVEAAAPLQLTGFPEPTRRRRWPLVLAASVAVVALVGGGLAAGAMLGRDGAAAPAGQASATEPSPTEPSATGASTAAAVPPTPARRAAAEQFVRWARGIDPAPPFAPRVRNLSPGFAGPWNDQPERREYWSGCSGLGFPDCGIDPIASLLRDPSEIAALAGRLECWGTPDLLGEEAADLPPRFATAEADAVHLQPVGAQGCDEGTLINLWIRPNGEIYGVALVLPVTADSTVTP